MFDEKEILVSRAKKYLKLYDPDSECDSWNDERVLKTINRVYFGGLTGFSGMIKKKSDWTP